MTILYNHAMMADHVNAQNALKAALDEKMQEALKLADVMAGFWGGVGSAKHQEMQATIHSIFMALFAKIDDHTVRTGAASGTAHDADLASAAGFSM